MYFSSKYFKRETIWLFLNKMSSVEKNLSTIDISDSIIVRIRFLFSSNVCYNFCLLFLIVTLLFLAKQIVINLNSEHKKIIDQSKTQESTGQKSLQHEPHVLAFFVIFVFNFFLWLDGDVIESELKSS
jgi:hypothetical protein